MQIVRDFAVCPTRAKDAVLALGNFDGVHLGHQSILKHCVDFAKTEARPAAAMTFEPHPREFFKNIKSRSAFGENVIFAESSGAAQAAALNGPRSLRSPLSEPIRIYPFRKKAEFLQAAGIDFLFVARFNARFAAIPASAFVENILCGQLNVRHVVTGYNFAFGKGRGGDTRALTEEAAKRGFGFTACSAVQDEGHTVSSSAIRAALEKGDVALATRMLGRPYSVCGRVRRGQQRGRQLGFPTANLPLTHLFKPRFGVYAARAELPGKKPVEAVVNIGIKPTFSDTEPLLEAHLFGVEGDFYGARLKVVLVQWLRAEQKFSSTEDLRAQIRKDCAEAQKVLAV